MTVGIDILSDGLMIGMNKGLKETLIVAAGKNYMAAGADGAL